ncbi:MAG: glycosyltransferase family 4 protein, partial [Lachnospiraceae bacterium]|nr:glycosyltransferase family 4 protein [Lachnospiraceae bacterium]
ICQEMDDLEEIVKLGQVENLEEIYHKVRVIINPTLMGTGLNIKASEAVFYQKPMVTTSCGARGFCNQEPIFEVADAPEEFAGKVIDLLVNDRKCELLMENCRRYNEKYERENMERLRSIGNDITENI